MPARVALTAQEIGHGGAAETFVAASAAATGNKYPCDGKCWLHVKNTGTIKVLTVQTPGTVDGLAVAERTISIPATTGDVMIPPFPPSQYAQADGYVYIDVDLETAVTFAVFRPA
jgi:hypothetical protein